MKITKELAIELRNEIEKELQYLADLERNVARNIDVSDEADYHIGMSAAYERSALKVLRQFDGLLTKVTE